MGLLIASCSDRPATETADDWYHRAEDWLWAPCWTHGLLEIC